MPLLMNAVNYLDGSAANPADVAETARLISGQQASALVGLSDPSDAELAQLQAAFGIHRLAIEDSAHGHQRAKLERYGQVLYLVLRPAVYLDEEEEIRLGELHLFCGPAVSGFCYSRCAEVLGGYD
ncbi:MAG: CorA family divalent cation transporter [Rothia sp. (in: high G+C Gram-positive bacteria)]|nr:CorA family divalent cation transporter [Rothia sp. (in: high G+C Gram-positive bacteria)]